MNKQYFLSSWLKRFLLEYLLHEKNLSLNTQRSYRDTFQLCLPFIARKTHKKIDQLKLEDFSPEVIKKFLLHLESNRHCSITTRNQRLSAIHAIALFIGANSPEHIEWCRQIRLIPFKRTAPTCIHYLEKEEMDALLNAPDCLTKQGKRDHALLLLLYNTGVRADELAQITIGDLVLAQVPTRDFSFALIKGKGKKLRKCPLWKQTVKELFELIQNRDKSEHVFLNRHSQPITRFGIYGLVKRYVEKIRARFPALGKKQVSPHTIRHTTATHLLRAGVDINTIRAWLGHVSINTTNIYAEVDLEMKAKALALCEITGKPTNKAWRSDENLMAFLKSL